MYCQDFKEYKNSRGFTAPIESLIDEKIATNEDEFIMQLNSLFKEQDGWGKGSFPFEKNITNHLFREIGIL